MREKDGVLPVAGAGQCLGAQVHILVRDPIHSPPGLSCLDFHIAPSGVNLGLSVRLFSCPWGFVTFRFPPYRPQRDLAQLCQGNGEKKKDKNTWETNGVFQRGMVFCHS